MCVYARCSGHYENYIEQNSGTLFKSHEGDHGQMHVCGRLHSMDLDRTAQVNLVFSPIFFCIYAIALRKPVYIALQVNVAS